MKQKQIVRLLMMFLSVAMLLSACGFLSKQPPAATKEDDIPTTTKSTFVPPETSKETEIVTSEEITEPVHEHTWVEANFQEPKTCSVCFQTEGSPLPAAFETNGYPINMIVESTYDYKTIGSQDPTKEVITHVAIIEYSVIASDETHEAKEGYEWKILHAFCDADSDDFFNYGGQLREAIADYYSGDLYFEDQVSTFSYKSEEAECYVEFTQFQGDWYEGNVEGGETEYTYVYEYEYAVQTPIGYDGCVFVLYNAVHGSYELGGLEDITNTVVDLVDEDSLFFRMGNL
jgi:hypothetical protein